MIIAVIYFMHYGFSISWLVFSEAVRFFITLQNNGNHKFIYLLVNHMKLIKVFIAYVQVRTQDTDAVGSSCINKWQRNGTPRLMPNPTKLQFAKLALNLSI